MSWLEDDMKKERIELNNQRNFICKMMITIFICFSIVYPYMIVMALLWALLYTFKIGELDV